MSTTTTTTTNGTARTSAPSPAATITRRASSARGHADHGWLHTHHTFAFGTYRDAQHGGYGPLRVINEDRVARSTGFGAHGHAEYLIWSYVVGGELEHRDSLGNVETLRRGDVQFTSAGTGIRHSEFNRNEDLDNHFLQIWAKPSIAGLAPTYVTRHFPDALKRNALVRITESVSRHDGSDAATAPIPMHADVTQLASILSPGRSVTHALVAAGARKVYVHVVRGGRAQPAEGGAQIRVGGEVVLREGDGAYVDGASGEVTVESVGDREAEFLLFDMGE